MRCFSGTALTWVRRPPPCCSRTLTSTRHLRPERVVFRLVGVDPDTEQTAGVYTRSVLAFSARARPARPRHLLTEPGMGYRFQP